MSYRIKPNLFDRFRSGISGTSARAYAVRRLARQDLRTLEARRDAMMQRLGESAELLEQSRGKRLAEDVELLDRYIDPLERFMDGNRLLSPLGTILDRRSGKNLPLVWTELDLREFRRWARVICDINPYAIGFLGLQTDYHIRLGYTWHVHPRGLAATDDMAVALQDPDVREAQAVLDEWRDVVQWALKSREGFKRWHRDGEVFLRFFRGERRGLPAVRFVEPEQIGPPPGDDADGRWSFGILTEPDDVLTVHAYFVRHPLGTGSDGDVIESDRIIHLKNNVDCTIKRGITSFLPVQEDLEHVRKMIRNMGEVGAIQTAIAWVSQYAIATPEQVATLIAAGADYSRAKLGDPSGKLMNVSRYEPGTVIHMDSNRSFLPAPAQVNAQASVAVVQAILRGVGFRFRFPEWASGDASNNNYNSALVAGSSMTNAIECGQQEWGVLERGAAIKVLRLAAESGRLRRDILEKVDVRAVPPAVVQANREEENRIAESQNKAKVLSITTWRQKAGLNNDQENANFAAETKRGDGPAPGGAAGGAGDNPPGPAAPPGGGDQGGGDQGGDDVAQWGGIFGNQEGAGSRLPETFLVTEADRSHLRRKQITNSKGVKTWVWYNPDKDKSGNQAGRSNADYHATRDSEIAVAKAINNPESIHPDQLEGLATHLDVLRKDQLHNLAKQVQTKLTGPKKELVERLIKHIKDSQPKLPQPGDVGTLKTDFLKVDPARFQFKLNTSNPAGVTSEFAGVKTFNPEFAGIISVWRDPADGHTYVVNGHHRVELARRTGHPELAVRYLDAKDAREARAKGALINIAEGRGTAVDAAKFMRDMDVSPADLEKHGVSLKGKVAADAAVLTKLNDQAFERLALGRLDPDRAVAVAKHLADPERQERLFGLLAKREEEGKDLSNRTVEELARQMAAVPSVKTQNQTLWGTEETDEDTFVERGELAGYARAELAKEMNDFSAVASDRRAAKVASTGNTLNVAANKDKAQQAEQAKLIFDQHANLRGPIADALDAGAVKLKQAKKKSERERVRSETFDEITRAIQDFLNSLGGKTAQQ